MWQNEIYIKNGWSMQGNYQETGYWIRREVLTWQVLPREVLLRWPAFQTLVEVAGWARPHPARTSRWHHWLVRTCVNSHGTRGGRVGMQTAGPASLPGLSCGCCRPLHPLLAAPFSACNNNDKGNKWKMVKFVTYRRVEIFKIYYK